MLTFRPIQTESDGDIAHLVRWSNDESIRHLFLRNKNQDDYERKLSLDLARRRVLEALADGREVFILEHDSVVIGEVSLHIDSPSLVRARPHTAWIGLVVGEPSARGLGVGRQAMLFIEEIARKRGAHTAQVGVFEFNHRAQRLYSSLAYKKLCTTPNFTWWNGKMWSDTRMTKGLTESASF